MAGPRRRPGGDRTDERLGRLAALAEPVRRALYRYVASRPEPVSREQAAAAVGVAPHTAKFHLDRLESDGLLDAAYQRPEGRRGPGAGRPPKVYRPSAEEIAVSLPERRYELVGAVLAAAVDAANRSAWTSVTRCARAAEAAGRELGGPGSGAADVERASPTSATTHAPRTVHSCSTTARSTSWPGPTRTWSAGSNLAFVRGLLASTGAADRFSPRLAPAPGRCCVLLEAGAGP